MTDLEKDLLIDINGKVRQLIARQEILKQEKHQLLGKIGDLENTIKEIRQEKRLIETKYDNIKIAKMLVASDDENKEAKNRIQKLVREIDKCIALLNK